MIELHYLDIAPDMEKNLTFSAENVQNTRELDSLHQLGERPVFATCEWDGWPLDGSRKLMDADHPPVWSREMSGVRSGFLGAGALGSFTLDSADCALETPPFIEVKVSRSCTVPGITFVFSPRGHWCRKLELHLYLGEEQVYGKILYPDAPRWIFPARDLRFDRLTVRLLETDTPGCYAKLSRLYLGRALVFGYGETESVQLVNEADPTLDALTVDTMTVEVQDLQQRELSPKQDQRMELYRDGQLLASHYIESCTRRDRHHYTFRCRSLVGQLEDTFLGGMYEKTPIKTLLTEILQDVPFEMDAALENIRISGYLPVCTRRQALQQVAFAAGAVVSTRGVRGVRLSVLAQQVSGTFQAQTQFRDGAVETVAGISRIEAVAHKYTPSREEVTLVEEEYFNGTDILLTFTEPYHSYKISGGTLLEQGVNHIRLSATGEVTVKACPYRHTTVRHSRIFNPGQGTNRNQIRKVEQATLVHAGNVVQILNRLGAVYALQQTLTQTVVVDGQFAGQQVVLADPFGGLVKGYITAMESELTPGGQTARITLMGQLAVPQIAVGYAGMLYAGEKEEML